PVPMGSQNGNIQSGVQAAARNHYKKADGSTDPLAYGEKTLENSPLDRVLAQAAPGSDWDGKKVQYQYQANADGEVYRYTTSTSWSNNATVSVLGLSGTYGANSLYKNVVTDEDGNSTIEFKNGQGQTLLVRKKNGSENLDTYYVYNEYNQLAFVIPPLAIHKGVDATLLNELAYQYRYDGQNRLVEKKLPGKDWEYMVYDRQDRLVLTQDGKLRQQNKWLFTKYDKFGRVAYTGLLDSAPGRDAQQSNMVNFGINNEERSTSGFAQNGTTVYYSSSAYPVGNFTLLTVNYYDEYPPGSPAVFNGASVLGSNPVNGRSTKGLPVASMVKNIEDNGWTKSYTWYDDKARPVATESQNHLGGYTRTSSVLAFSGVPTSTTTYHKRDASSGEMVMKEDFSYDHQNRLVKHTHQVNGGPVEVLTENIYNELGQLEARNIGNGIQSIKNEYNIRGALTKMNDPKNLMNKLFGFELKYINPAGTSKKYNGNIAETDWATQSDGTLRHYSYQYDGVNRLKEGNYWDNAGAASGSYAEKLNYDLNGNITGLQRTGQGAGVMDQLSYTYDQSGNSNKLIRVNDASGNAAGYPVGGNTIVYDIDGNMVNHLDKGISNIAYNYLNLPSSITASIGNTDYVYRADGTKVRKVFGGKTTDYLDGFQYENGVLQFVPTSEGYYDVVKNKYIYNYTDHLGNVRLSYTKGASGGAEIIEENNYYPFGLKHQGYNTASLANSAYQYKYNGKELQETGMYDYGARMYMPELGRWGVVDPLAEKMTRHSPYNYAFNNPIRFIDPDGRDVLETALGTSYTGADAQAVFRSLQNSKRNPPNDYIFDEKGNYVRTDKNDQPHRLIIENSKTKARTNYTFADPKEDSKQIELGIINKIVFVPENDIVGMLKEQGAFKSGKLNFIWESQGGGDFDYSYSVLPNKYNEASPDPLNNYSTALFLPEGDSTAHNQMNFGNYLWGATGYTVNFGYGGLQIGAHLNSRFNSRRNGYTPQWDSKDDQRSIVLGAHHAAKNNYRAKKK
ncbi:RHS repeat-associated core domain-containing protein, partial [Elizabethkingia anophelis]|nr:RHS repeat-associated core domain-containing protein [Elizabethkingia anophelis]MCT3827921.1 RHS repeat-associated core domain-containing protein [Elizabethkingia anophelis]MCT3842551.1 RHS repeat-associated core domain-containing protein [Elizabethkingia anophelis]MCT3849713.1 RHS repeat-associated core domain-containing protein [Elizabethkingia anophelis]MCT3910126.1 RHS repeat-associated core domain-containing protein [Elizabethkingia anophelis]